MRTGWLIPHQERERAVVDGVVVYCDPRGPYNQDPYVWNRRFLHTYCHITQMSAQPEDVCLWVHPRPWPLLISLPCDLVFVVGERCPWADANSIALDDPIVDSPHAYADHYSRHGDHPYSRRHRYTLKADPERSFQPQTAGFELLDISPMLADRGLDIHKVRAGLRAGYAGKPMRIPVETASAVAGELAKLPVRRSGLELEALRMPANDDHSTGRAPAGGSG